MPEDVTARHRSGGVGRLLTVRAATPRHAAPAATPPAAGDPALRPRRWPWALSVVAVLMLVAVAPLTLRTPEAPQPAAPLPTISLPPLPTETDPAPDITRRELHAVRQAAKSGVAPSSASASAPSSSAAAPVLLGPATNADLPPLLNSYCRATYGRFTAATLTAAGWVCGPFGRPRIALDMDAMCRWNYGDGASAVLGSDTDPQSWRCYRAGP